MSKIEVNTVDVQCGSTLTLGSAGKTVQLASGASQSGFGRTGTVNWVTTKKTTSFTAVSGEGYFVDTSSGAVTATLPSSPSAGDIVGFNDYARTFATNNLTVGRNGSNIQGVATNGTISSNGQSTMFVYVDATKGWIPTEDQTTNDYGFQPVVATGGTITTSGDFKIHTFTSPGTFTVTCAGSGVVDYLVVAGGGGGGGYGGSGGGGGGFRLSNTTCMPAPLTSPLANPTGVTVTATAFPITVGAGGAAGAGNPGGPSCNAASGSNSIFSTITSSGGGGGRSFNSLGVAGGSGSGGRGGAGPSTSNPYAGGAGNTPPVSPSQGNTGGNGFDGVAVNTQGGGGGGAGAVGSNASAGDGGDGGAGSFVIQTGLAGCNGTPGPVSSSRYFSGGGGGGACAQSSLSTGGAGGGGNGGGAAGPSPSVFGTAGGTNTGGGGGGNGNCTPSGGPKAAGAGGSGIVVIRYKFQ